MAEEFVSGKDTARRRFSEGMETESEPTFAANQQAGPSSEEPSSEEPSSETGNEPKVWLHKFNITKDDQCTVLVTLQAPKTEPDATYLPIDKGIYVVTKKMLDTKYRSAATSAYQAAKESDPEGAQKAGEMAGIAALAGDEFPKEIAEAVQTEVLSILTEVMKAPEDIVETVRTVAAMKVKTPTGESKAHAAEVAKPKSTCVISIVRRALQKKYPKTTTTVTTEVSAECPMGNSLESLLMGRQSVWNELIAAAGRQYAKTTVDPSESITREEKTIATLRDTTLKTVRAIVNKVDPEMLASVPAGALEEEIESFARISVMLAKERATKSETSSAPQEDNV